MDFVPVEEAAGVIGLSLYTGADDGVGEDECDEGADADHSRWLCDRMRRSRSWGPNLSEVHSCQGQCDIRLLPQTPRSRTLMSIS